MSYLGRPWLAVGLILLGCGLAPIARGGPTPSGQTAPIANAPALFSGDDLMLLEVDSAGFQLTDSFGAYASRAGLFLPLGELARLLDLSVSVDPARGRAEGWILTENRTFQLDLASRQVQIAGRAIGFSQAQAVAFNGDIYLRADLIEQILPLKLKPDLHQLVLNILPTQKLPFQDRLLRERKRERLGSGPGAEPVLMVNTPYELFTAPALDVNVSLGGGTYHDSIAHYDLNAAGDLGGAGYQVFASSDNGGRLDSVRILLQRRDPDGRDVGIRGLTSASAGDTYTPYLQIGARGAAGRGFAVTSAPLEQASVFDKIDLRGDLPAGYEVELYVNEVLRGSIAQSTDGRYAFDQVELAFGLNTIRLTFYGPHGERREEVRRIDVGIGALAKGKLVFSLGAVQENTPLVDLTPAVLALCPSTQPTGGGGVPPTVGAPTCTPVPIPVIGGQGSIRVVGQLAYGLTGQTTLTAGFAHYTPLVGAARDMTSLGIATSKLGFALQAVGAADDKGGGAAMFAVAGRPFGVSLVASHSEYVGGFVDEQQAAALAVDNTLSRDTTVALDWNTSTPLGPMPVSLRASQDGYGDGGDRLSLVGRVSKPISRYLISSSVDYESFVGPASSLHTLNTEVDVSGLVGGGWQLRGALVAQRAPALALSSISAVAQHSFGKAALTFGASQSFGVGGGATFGASSTWRLRDIDVTLASNYSTEHHDFRFGVQFSTGLLFDPLRRRYRDVGPGAAAGGAVAIDAFSDTNGDGRRESGEPGVAGIIANGGRYPVTTDAKGEALAGALGDSASARVRLDLDKIDDPYLTGPPSIVQITPRPGRVTVVPFPMAATSEIQLKAVYRRPGESPRGLSALVLQLIDSKGAVAAEGHTEYDGTLVLENLKPGDYALRIAPDQAARLHLALKTAVTITAKSGGGYAGEVQVEIVSQAPAPN